MQEQKYKEIYKLIKQKEELQGQIEGVKIESMKPSRQSDNVLLIGSSGIFSSCPVNIFTLVDYLKSEIERINVQLEGLGVELER